MRSNLSKKLFLSNIKENKFKIILLSAFVFFPFFLFRFIYPEGLFFTGWDNLHPEFNLLAYFEKIILGGWVEHQGLGAPPAQSQLSEIFRFPIVAVLTILLPKWAVRWVFHYLMIMIGCTGMFLLFYKYYLKSPSLTKRVKVFSSLLVSFFYLFNIYTLQQEYISFELFIVQYAFLPFLFLSSHKIVEERKITYFVIFSLLIAPSGHTPTVFYLLFPFIYFYLFVLFLEKSNSLRNSIFKSSEIIFLFFLLNSYWIIPNLYYLLTNDSAYTSYSNTVFRQESFWSVIEAGKLNNFFKGTHYLFSWKDFNFYTNSYEYIFKEWIEHFENKYVSGFLVLLNISAIVGGLVGVFSKEKKEKILAVFLYISLFIVWIGLFVDHRFLSFIFSIPSFSEAFRNPFTKFQVILSFFFTVNFGFFIRALLEKFNRDKDRYFCIFVYFVLLIIVFFPVFKGNLINEKLKVKIPKEYFDLYSFLNTQNPNLRILELPFYSYSGWVYNNWIKINGYGYQGVGLNFFGIRQKYLTSDFSRWQKYNDSFYHELEYALNNKDKDYFKYLLKKYNVNLILVDETFFDPVGKKYNIAQLKSLLNYTGCDLYWSKNFLHLYRCNFSSYAYLPDSDLIFPQKVFYVYKLPYRINFDPFFNFEGKSDYVFFNKEKSIVFPFAYLSKNYLEDFKRNFKIGEDYLIIEADIKDDEYEVGFSTNSLLNISKVPFYYDVETNSFIPLEVSVTGLNNESIVDFKFLYNIDGKKLSKKVLLLNSSKCIKKSLLFYNDSIHLKDSPYILLDSQEENVFYKMCISKDNVLIPQEEIFLNIKEPYVHIKKSRIFGHKFKALIRFPVLNVDLKKLGNLNCVEKGQILTEIKSSNEVVYRARNFGVNCSSLSYYSDYLANFDSLILFLEGENLKGRSIKLFLNQENEEVLNRQFILPRNNFSYLIMFREYNTQENYKPSFDLTWETRSFGGESINSLSSIKIAYLPASFLSNLYLKPADIDFSSLYKYNELHFVRSLLNLPFLRVFEVMCKQGKECFFSNNQSYDESWIAFSVKEGFLKKGILNNWANIWLIEESGNAFIIVFSLLDLLSLSLFLFSLLLILFIFKYKSNIKKF